MARDIILYVGTYTLPLGHVPESRGKGIHWFKFDTETGMLSAEGSIDGIENPSYLAINRQKQVLYACSEVNEGIISAYAIQPQTGALTYRNQQSAQGSTTAHVAVDQHSQFVLTANYMGQNAVALLPINADGSLAPATSTHDHTLPVVGTVPSRQDAPHAHSITTDPSNRFALVCDLGLDKIMVYQLDAANQQLIPHDPLYFDTHAGAGPRHLTFHPTENIAYVIQELNATVAVLSFDAENGTLAQQQIISTLPEDFMGQNTTAALHVSADGRYLYASNRGHDSIAIYAINPDTGNLTLVAIQASGGKTPRDFILDPSGEFLLVAHQDSHTIVTFRINSQTGTLTQVASSDCPTPVCLKMTIIDPK